jgi:hypothetical protein
MSPDAIKLGGMLLVGAVVGGVIWRFVSSRMTNQRPSTQQSGRPQGSFADLFEGTAELKEAFEVIGHVAINHAGVEDALNYLLWQLRAYEFSTRNKQKSRERADIQDDLRQMRREAKKQLIVHKLVEVRELLARERVLKRLREAGRAEEVGAKWQELEARALDLSDKRNDVVHSALAFAGGGVVRQIGDAVDQRHVPVNIQSDGKLVSELGKLAIEVGIFTTDLGYILPFPADDQIITSVVNIDLGQR